MSDPLATSSETAPSPAQPAPASASSAAAEGVRGDESSISARLSKDLLGLLPQDPAKVVTIRDILHQLADRGVAIMLILFSVPFLQPIPMVGLSTPFGIVIGLLGISLMLNRDPWLPAFVLNREIPRSILKLLVEKGSWVAAKTEWTLKQRWTYLCAQGFPERFHGFNILVMAFLLSLPIPAPWTNTMPALGIMFMSLALLEKDGLFVIFSYVAQLGTYIYFGVIAAGAYAAGTLGLSFFGF